MRIIVVDLAWLRDKLYSLRLQLPVKSAQCTVTPRADGDRMGWYPTAWVVVTVVIMTNVPQASTQRDSEGYRLPTFQFVPSMINYTDFY